jgi:predicted NodU family carbamoyl transferase
MRILGINCLNHDAAMAVVDGRDILWAAHSERYSKIKNDHYLNQAIVDEAMTMVLSTKLYIMRDHSLRRCDRHEQDNGQKYSKQKIYPHSI